MSKLRTLFLLLGALALVATPGMADKGKSGGDDKPKVESSDNSGKGSSDDNDNSGKGGSDDNDDRGSGNSSDDDGTPDQGGQNNDNVGQPGQSPNDDGTADQGGQNNDNNGGNGQTEDRNRFFFSRTSAGASIGARGHVDIRVRGVRQKITVEVEANVVDDSTFLILANGEPIGAVRTAFGEGELELKNFDGQTLPPAADPVTGVTRVEVKDADGVLVLELIR